jgi:hypothetical protein
MWDMEKEEEEGGDVRSGKKTCGKRNVKKRMITYITK